MNFDLLILGMVVVFMVLAILFVTIELMHFVISRIETNRKAREALKQQQS